jgi:hypothetical protein
MSEIALLIIGLIIFGSIFIIQCLYVGYHWSGRSWYGDSRCKVNMGSEFKGFWFMPSSVVDGYTDMFLTILGVFVFSISGMSLYTLIGIACIETAPYGLLFVGSVILTIGFFFGLRKARDFKWRVNKALKNKSDIDHTHND